MGRGHWRGVERWNGEVGSKGVNSLLPQPGPCYPGLAAHCGASDWVQMGSHRPTSASYPSHCKCSYFQ